MKKFNLEKFREASYLIAEVGQNHQGDLDLAREYIKVFAAEGADAVKFQTFRGIDIVSPKVKADEYKGWDVKGFEFWHQFLDTIALKLEDHQAVIDYTNSKGMDFITTPTSPYIVDFLETLKGIKSYKVASMDLNNIPLLKAIANTDKEVIMSTGMGDMIDIAKAVEIFKSETLLENVTTSTRQQIVHLDWDQIAEQVESVFRDAIRMK